MENLKKCITEQISIDKNSLGDILSKFQTVNLKKGDFFLRSGKVCQSMAFINSGYLRMYSLVDGNEITFWVGSKERFITSLSSFIFQTSNFWNIQALTDCELYVINRDNHYKLIEQQPKWLEFDNRLLAKSFAMLERSMLAQLHTTAAQRLKNLMEQEPDLLLNVPHQYLASMIGIAPESFSRLRKNLTKSIS